MKTSSRRALARVLAPALLALLAPVVLASPAAAAIPAERQANYLWARSNELRRSSGEGTLQTLEPLMARARALAGSLAARGELQHSDLQQVTPRWTLVGENIGRSGTVQDVTSRLFASPSHRHNILDGRFTHTGVGTHRAHDGTLYVVQLFWRG